MHLLLKARGMLTATDTPERTSVRQSSKCLDGKSPSLEVRTAAVFVNVRLSLDLTKWTEYFVLCFMVLVLCWDQTG